MAISCMNNFSEAVLSDCLGNLIRGGIKMSRPRDLDKTITYVCEREGCDNVRTKNKKCYEKDRTHYCGERCYNEVRRLRKEKNLVNLVCANKDCGKEFKKASYEIKNRKKIYCSISCKAISHTRFDPTTWITFTCDRPKCNNQRTERLLNHKRYKSHYCSTECAGIDRVLSNKKHSTHIDRALETFEEKMARKALEKAQAKRKREISFAERWKEIKWN